ncbi:MAG: hypothetical protein WCH31_05715 [Actinomycetes bacterium]
MGLRRRTVSTGLIVAALVPSARAGPDSITLRLTSVAVRIVPTDIRPAGASRGDTVTYRDTLVNASPQFGRKTGATVGQDEGTMTFTGPTTATFDGKAVLPNGTIRLYGPVKALPGGALGIPVAGGTGRYAHAHGTLTVGVGQGKRAPNTYSLVFTSGPVA